MISVTPQSHASGKLTLKMAVAQAVAQRSLIWGGYFGRIAPIVLAAGQYQVSRDDLTPVLPSGQSLVGLTVMGEGYGAVELVVSGAGYLLNDTDLAASVTLQNLMITGKTGVESAFNFAGNFGGRVYDCRVMDCVFGNLATAISFGGTQVTSESKIERCHFDIAAGQTGIRLNNSQSVNHWWRAISVEGAGTWLDITAGGMVNVCGLDISMTGGAVINIDGPAVGFGPNNAGYFFHAVKTELSGNAMLLTNSTGQIVTFSKSNFNPTTGLAARIKSAMPPVFEASCFGASA